MSNILVIHPDDRSTDMLKIIYEGKDFDVINDYNTSDEDIVKAINEHDTIIMLGHGTPRGLLCGDGTHRFARFIIGPEHASLLKEKKTYSMWCHSDEYFRRYHIGGFHSGMIISEEAEAQMFGMYGYSDDDIYQLLVPLMEAMHDTIEMDDLEEMRDIILERYNNDDPVTQFNRENILIL